METRTDVANVIIDATLKYEHNAAINYFGHKMFDMFTRGGFPPDMFLEELAKRNTLDLLARVYIVSVYQGLFLEHRRKSGVQEKNLDRLRRKNTDDIKRIIDGGELGIY